MRIASNTRPGPLLQRLALLLALAAVAYLGVKVQRLEQLVLPVSEGEVERPRIVARGELSDIEQHTTELFRNASPSVVHITTLNVAADPFQLRVLEVPRGTGSGFVWDAQGHLVTNLHVVQGAGAARVTLSDQSVWPAQLVGASRRNDLAVLKVPAAVTRARALPVGSSSDLVVGQMAVAIGSPFGLDYTLSTGVISGLGREIPGMMGLPIRGAIQTDAVINPGNSGGPLLDSSGRLIGVNTAILSPTGVSVGIGFAVPVDTVARIVPQLIRYGSEVRPVIGVELAEDDLTRRLGLRGALVLDVVPDSPAERAGLRGTLRELPSGRIQIGDVIVGLDEVAIDGKAALHEALDSKQPGDRVQLRVLRQGESLSLSLVLGSNVEGEE